jgi:hypothetical protein
MAVALKPFSFESYVEAVEQVRQRLLRATAALGAAGVDYAVADGNAVAAWVTRVNPAAVRATQDVDILLRRDQLSSATTALEAAGFVYRHAAGLDIFLDGNTGDPRAAVHVIFANEKVRPHELVANPDVAESEMAQQQYRVLSLEALVRVKLTAFRRKDQVHLGDLIDIGLIDATWPARFPSELGDRLQHLLDTPDG